VAWGSARRRVENVVGVVGSIVTFVAILIGLSEAPWVERAFLEFRPSPITSGEIPWAFVTVHANV